MKNLKPELKPDFWKCEEKKTRTETRIETRIKKKKKKPELKPEVCCRYVQKNYGFGRSISLNFILSLSDRFNQSAT